MDTQLNFINRSGDVGNSEIVIFQKNVATGFDESAIAWRVIRNCGQGDFHPFLYPTTMQVSSSDSYGNYTPRLDARPGQSFAHVSADGGDKLVPAGAASQANEVQIVNNALQGAINVHIYRDGALLAIRTSLAPQQIAAFQFLPTIWIGAVPQVMQSEVMDSAIVQQVNTELTLLGIASADIVMTRGGPGPDSLPPAFNLENVVRS